MSGVLDLKEREAIVPREAEEAGGTLVCTY